MMNLHEIAEQASTLFVLPDSVTRLKACMDDEAASIDDVAEIIAFDPSLTSQLLKVANSALYRFPNRITTISKALQVIGTRASYDLALAYGVSHAFSRVDAKVIDLDKFWEQSVSCGLLAKYFAEEKQYREPERLFVSGLLHDVGQLVIVSRDPDAAKKCDKFNQKVTPKALQQSVLGFTYADLSALLIASWGIPRAIYEPIAAIHSTHTDSTDTTDKQILRLSYSLALDNVNPEIYPSYNNLDENLHKQLKLERSDLEDALDITNLQCMSVIALFNPSAYMLY